MDSVLTKAELEAVLDAAVREVTPKTAGVDLRQGGEEPSEEDLCTVHIAFLKGFRSSLSLRADRGMLAQMTRNAICTESVTPQDLEDFAKEYFNVLCGRVAGLVYQTTKIAARLSVPVFRWGRFEPEGQQKQLVLNYIDGKDQGAQLIHHVPRRDGADAAAPGDE